MPTIRLARRVLAWLMVLALMPTVVAGQGTDGYRSHLLFPIVVDSASFKQRFTFRANGLVTVAAMYYPAELATPAPLDCGSFQVDSNRSFASLRDICPGLPLGTQYGMLRLIQTGSDTTGFAGFSRVSNPQGNGFSVEAFGMDQFRGAKTYDQVDAEIVGLRRLAATANSPAFQTNCFYGIAPANNTNVITGSILDLKFANATSGQLNKTAYPGTLYRLLDVFAALGAPAGDFDNVVLTINQRPSSDHPFLPVVAFCTVQDNTSFGADFRIGKLAEGEPGYESATSDKTEIPLPSGIPSLPFQITVNPFQDPEVNTHAIYFRHPDRIGCALYDVFSGLQLTNAYGLEMRLVEGDGLTVVAGGNLQTGFSGVYLGDKPSRNQGISGRYTLQVESNGLTPIGLLQYEIRCTSGSGHTHPELIQRGTGTRF